MTSNPVLLKRAMKALGMSGVALAKRISSYREDGRDTAPETVSRWVNGTKPVEPAVLAWLEELLRAKATSSSLPLVKWPSKGPIVLGVTNAKGGVGVTTVALALTVVAQRDFRMRTYHVRAGNVTDNGYLESALSRLGIDSVCLPFKKLLNTKFEEKDSIIIVDISSSAYKEILEEKEEAFLRNFNPDVLLVPADFGSRFDVASTKRLIDVKGLQGVIRLLHRPKNMEMDFAYVCGLEGLDVTSEIFYPSFIPQTKDSQIPIPADMFGPWHNPEQQEYYQDLLVYVVEMLGGEVQNSHGAKDVINSMGLIELIEHMERKR